MSGAVPTNAFCEQRNPKLLLCSSERTLRIWRGMGTGRMIFRVHPTSGLFVVAVVVAVVVEQWFLWWIDQRYLLRDVPHRFVGQDDFFQTSWRGGRLSFDKKKIFWTPVVMTRRIYHTVAECQPTFANSAIKHDETCYSEDDPLVAPFQLFLATSRITASMALCCHNHWHSFVRSCLDEQTTATDSGVAMVVTGCHKKDLEGCQPQKDFSR